MTSQDIVDRITSEYPTIIDLLNMDIFRGSSVILYYYTGKLIRSIGHTGRDPASSVRLDFGVRRKDKRESFC